MILLIKNGHVINPATETDEVADILAEDGKVVKMEKNIKAKADRVIDAKGCYVMPGFIDMHVHLRDPGQEQKETIETGCNAAAHGGYTTILAMPNTNPVERQLILFTVRWRRCHVQKKETSGTKIFIPIRSGWMGCICVSRFIWNMRLVFMTKKIMTIFSSNFLMLKKI